MNPTPEQTLMSRCPRCEGTSLTCTPTSAYGCAPDGMQGAWMGCSDCSPTLICHEHED